MNILNSYSLSPSSSYTIQEPKPTQGNLLKQAIKDYKDEFLTGLTDEERQKIKEKIREYISKLPKGEKINLAELKAYVASLLKQYGFKGNVDDMISTLIDETTQELKDESSTSFASQTAYEKLSATKKVDLPSDAPLDLKESQDQEESISHIINNADGSKSLIVMKNNIIISCCKITQEGDLIKSDLTSETISAATSALQNATQTA